MPAEQIVNQPYLEEFFRQHLALFDARAFLAVRIFRHEPSLVFHRGVILAKYELDLQKHDGTTQTIVLRGSFGPDTRRQKAYRILRALWQNGFDRGPYVVPEPVGYFDPPGLLLYHNINGSSLLQLFESGHNQYLKKVTAAVEWLIHFHHLKPGAAAEASFSWTEHEGEFRQLLNAVCEKFQPQAERIRAVGRLLLDQERRLLNPQTFTLVHGDYQPNNIIIAQGNVGVIDFNDALRYDELFDVAYFLTQTGSMLKRLQGIVLTEEFYALQQHYLAARAIPDDELTRKKLALFRAKTLLSIKALTSQGEGLKFLEEIELYAQKAI